MQLNLGIDVLQWIDANRDKKSRQAFIIEQVRKQMLLATIPTKENNDRIHVPNGAIIAPNQN